MPIPTPPWRLRPADPYVVERLSHEFGVSALLARLLAVRGLDDPAVVRRFLGHAPYELDPWALPGIEKAAHRLLQTLDTGEPVLVYGDYDADGVTATSLLFGYLSRGGYNAHYFLPHRFEDGYGMNLHALADLAERGFSLLITVDNGIASVQEVEFAHSVGMQVIITDHHTPPAVLPEPYALVNPRLGGCPPEMAGLAGVGVAYALIGALEALHPTGGTESWLDLVAIGSVADMAPLTGVNRTLVARGLHQMATQPRPGIQALAEIAGLTSLAALSASDIGFKLGPRINAAGRMDRPDIGLKLFLAEGLDQARSLAMELDRLNRLRQETSQAVEIEARAMVEADPALRSAPALVLAKDGWHHGVIGIVASRLAEHYHRPTLLLSGDGDLWKGSGRAPEPLNLFKALEAAGSHLVRWGGHAQAGGLACPRGSLEAVRRILFDVFAEQGAGSGPARPLWIDAAVSLAEITPQAVRELGWLQPTGQGNPEPVLAISEVAVVNQKLRGKDRRHLALELRDGMEIREAVGFGMGHLHPLPARVSVAFTPEFNLYGGTAKIQLRLHAVGEPQALDAEPGAMTPASGV